MPPALFTNNIAMTSKPPFHKQETRYSCVPASLRMVLSGFGVDLSESELRALCDCTPFSGTDALLAVEAARQLGFNATSKYNLSPANLEALLSDGNYPIVFVDLRPIDGIPEQHALVVIEMNANFVAVLDPLKGERLLPRDDFLLAWAWQRNLTIVIER